MRPPSASGRLTLLAFLGIVVVGGSNAIAIRHGGAELAPFWGATLRFGLAAVLLLALMVARRIPLPRGQSRLGVLLFGLTAFAGSYAALYLGLAEAPAPTAMVVVATVPLQTLVMATAIGLERLTARGIAGALVALAGIALVVGDQLQAAVPAGSLLALFAGASFIALSGVVVKRLPPGDPVAANALGMGVGAAVLAGLSWSAGETWALPEAASTWVSVLYLAVVGSVLLFTLVLYVLARWSASATSYATLAMPLVTIVGAALLLGESVGPLFVVGGVISMVGVYVGVVGIPSGVALGPRFLARAPAVAVTEAADANRKTQPPTGC